MIYRREIQIRKNERKPGLKIIKEKGCKKSIFMLFISYTINIYTKRVKAMGFILINERQRTKLPELVT